VLWGEGRTCLAYDTPLAGPSTTSSVSTSRGAAASASPASASAAFRFLAAGIVSLANDLLACGVIAPQEEEGAGRDDV
jgi:hypothetical protein